MFEQERARDVPAELSKFQTPRGQITHCGRMAGSNKPSTIYTKIDLGYCPELSGTCSGKTLGVAQNQTAELSAVLFSRTIFPPLRQRWPFPGAERRRPRHSSSQPPATGGRVRLQTPRMATRSKEFQGLAAPGTRRSRRVSPTTSTTSRGSWTEPTMLSQF